MATIQRIRILALLVPLLLGTACDPQGPGAMGQLMVSPGTDPVAGKTLEIRMVRDDGESFDPTVADLSVEYTNRQASFALSEIEFPFDYMIGGGLGSTEYEHWRVVAWVAESDDVDRPKVGESYGTRIFDVEDCGVIFAKYCGVMTGIDLEIDFFPAAAMTLPSIEKVYGDYNLRCATRDDQAASIGTYEVSISTDGGVVAETAGARDGGIENCWMVNLDLDDEAEVLLFTRVAGSGAYGQLYAYKLVGNDLHPIEIPGPDASLMDGYQGRDLYEITNGNLSRVFPIYASSDPNCCPDDGERRLAFDVANQVWKLSTNSTADN